MDWAIVIFLVVAGTTAGSLWWCASEVAKAGRDDSSQEVTTPDPWSTPRDNKHGAL